MTSSLTEHQVLEEWNSIPGEVHVPIVSATEITKLHIYDFDNTLFNSPVPNPQLYTKRVENLLRSSPHISSFGSWWDDPRPLEIIAKLMNHDSERAAFWNENLLRLARLSWRDTSTVSIVLTGRKEKNFHSLFGKLFQVSRDKWATEQIAKDDNKYSADDYLFNAICLKKQREETNTFDYKCKCILSFLDRYPNLEEVTIYDDRIHHINKFKNFFNSLLNTKIKWIIVPVAPRFHYLPIRDENTLIPKFVNEQERAESGLVLNLSRTPMQVGYFLTVGSQKKLLHWGLNYLRQHFKDTKVQLSNFAEYPMYIPCTAPGNGITASQARKCFTHFDEIQISKNNDNEKRSDEDIIKYFCSQKTMLSEWSTSFKVVAIAIREAPIQASSRKAQNNKAMEIYYRTIPVGPKKEAWTSWPEFIIVGYNYDKNLQVQMEEINSVLTNPKSLRWHNVKVGIKIKTYFGFFSKRDTDL